MGGENAENGDQPTHAGGQLSFELDLIGKMLLDFGNQGLVGPLGKVYAPNRLLLYFNLYLEALKVA
jgi:hypothetical protein